MKIIWSHIWILRWIVQNVKIKSRKTVFRFICRVRINVVGQEYKLAPFCCSFVVETIFISNLSNVAYINLNPFLKALDKEHKGNSRNYSEWISSPLHGSSTEPTFFADVAQNPHLIADYNLIEGPGKSVSHPVTMLMFFSVINFMVVLNNLKMRDYLALVTIKHCYQHSIVQNQMLPLNRTQTELKHLLTHFQYVVYLNVSKCQLITNQCWSSELWYPLFA